MFLAFDQPENQAFVFSHICSFYVLIKNACLLFSPTPQKMLLLLFLLLFIYECGSLRWIAISTISLRVHFELLGKLITLITQIFLESKTKS